MVSGVHCWRNRAQSEVEVGLEFERRGFTTSVDKHWEVQLPGKCAARRHTLEAASPAKMRPGGGKFQTHGRGVSPTTKTIFVDCAPTSMACRLKSATW